MDASTRASQRHKSRQSIAHVPFKTESSDKDNVTADVATLRQQRDSSTHVTKKKTRGKSLGPGGLEALQESSGNTAKSATPLQIKSILKPTVPLTPPKAIPSFDELRKKNTSKSKSPAEELLIDFSTPGVAKWQGDNVSMSGVENVQDPFSPIKDITSDNGQNGMRSQAQEGEAESKRQAEKQAILDRRAARRKSLANRRVSFAPEATLHTWSVMEMVEDSTTSSASNSTRRQSSMTTAQSPMTSTQSPMRTLDNEISNAQHKADSEIQVQASPPRARADLPTNRKRRSSGIGPELLVASVEAVLSSSPSSSYTAGSSPVRFEDGADSESIDSEDDTAMSMDESTSHTVQSGVSGSSTESSLDERLRRAADQAGTRGIDYDENGDDLPMEMVTATVTHAFQPWQQTREELDNRVMDDQENFNPFLPASKVQNIQAQSETDEELDAQDMSMDVTHAVGGIIAQHSIPSENRRKSMLNGRRASIARRRSSGNESSFEEETMDFTTVGGGIVSNGAHDGEDVASDEEMMMEFTTAVGGLLGTRRDSAQSVHDDGNETMDMTMAVGGILPPIEEHTEPQTDVRDDQTIAMDMTRAVGSILSSQLNSLKNGSPERITQEKLKGKEADDATTPIARKQEIVSDNRAPVISIASETGSPDFALKPRLSGRARQSNTSQTTTPISTAKQSTPIRTSVRSHRSTPTKQLTPVPIRAETPNKSPLSANVTHRGVSPKKLFKEEIKAKASPVSNRKLNFSKPSGLFAHDNVTGQHTPRVVLKASRPKDYLRRRSSGVGIDQEGYGSPQVTELLDRRSSISDTAPEFKLDHSRRNRLRFEDPRAIEHEIDVERAEAERCESGRFVMEQEANEQQDENATLQLREMIESMTPKKEKATSKLRGRKSLAVGAARGLLGKRPAELDLDEDDDLTPKRLKAVSREGSPVKQIHLPKPPTKEETTGRLSRAEQLSLKKMNSEGSTTPALERSPIYLSTVSSPQVVNRFRDPNVQPADPRPESFEEKLDNVIEAVDVSIAKMEIPKAAEEKVSLQAFLNMTNIHFIELSTTKRRHTIAPSSPAKMSQQVADESGSKSTFVAASTTLPLLELYQHATRELKSYISAGRKIIRSIEAETLAEQPLLFKEYVDARPDVRAIMDNQFRNGKSNARLQSKEGWYAWRAQLVHGLHSGLQGIKNGMANDIKNLNEQQTSLDRAVPFLLEQQASLNLELVSLQQNIVEFESVDTKTLHQNRRELQAADEAYAEKLAVLDKLRRQISDKEQTLESAAELRLEILQQIAEADRVSNEHRGWPSADVTDAKLKVISAERQSGWQLVSAEDCQEDSASFGPALIMVYKNELRLFFYPSVFSTNSDSSGRRRSGGKSRSLSGPTAPISLTYAPSCNDEEATVPDMPTEKRFFFQLIRSQLHTLAMMPCGSVLSSTLLRTVSQGWEMATQISEEIRRLNIAGITTASILNDETLQIKVMLLVKDRSRVNVKFDLSVALSNEGEISSTNGVSIQCVYGSIVDLFTGSSGKRIQQELTKDVEHTRFELGSWVKVIRKFEEFHRTPNVPKPVLKAENLQPPTESTSPKRSPLAPKRSNIVQKKALPVPKNRVEKPIITAPAQMEKENWPMPTLAKHSQQTDEFEVTKPAIPPELQEAMMHTPIKRVGALRRSPV